MGHSPGSEALEVLMGFISGRGETHGQQKHLERVDGVGKTWGYVSLSFCLLLIVRVSFELW
jgi:hypothetical protein